MHGKEVGAFMYSILKLKSFRENNRAAALRHTRASKPFSLASVSYLFSGGSVDVGTCGSWSATRLELRVSTRDLSPTALHEHTGQQVGGGRLKKSKTKIKKKNQKISLILDL